MTPSAYERRALAELARWREPRDIGLRERVRRRLEQPVDRAIDAALDLDLARLLVDATVHRALEAIEEAALRDLEPATVLARFRPPAPDVAAVLERDLEEVDDVVAATRATALRRARVEGAAAGVLGGWALPIDVAALLGIGLRAVGEVAVACGVDPHAPGAWDEVLARLATPPDPRGGRPLPDLDPSPLAPGELTARRTLAVARNVLRKEVRGAAAATVAGGASRVLVRRILMRLAHSRLGLAVPLSGAAVGAAVNGRFVGSVLDEAEAWYRQRFLLAKYGRAVVEAG